MSEYYCHLEGHEATDTRMFIPEAYASEANDCQIVLGLPVLLLAVYVCKQLKIN